MCLVPGIVPRDENIGCIGDGGSSRDSHAAGVKIRVCFCV